MFLNPQQLSSDYVITRQGVAYILYTGLLVAAHRSGLVSISVRLLQFPANDNGWVAVCSSVVTTGTGAFTALGDAHHGNPARADVSTLVLLAQPQAKAHALCDALNLGLTPNEDLPGYVAGSLPPPPPPARARDHRTRGRIWCRRRRFRAR